MFKCGNWPNNAVRTSGFKPGLPLSYPSNFAPFQSQSHSLPTPPPSNLASSPLQPFFLASLNINEVKWRITFLKVILWFLDVVFTTFTWWFHIDSSIPNSLAIPFLPPLVFHFLPPPPQPPPLPPPADIWQLKKLRSPTSIHLRLSNRLKEKSSPKSKNIPRLVI